MQQIEIAQGSRKVIATRNGGKWQARLYVNNGETATLTARKFASVKGVEKWAGEVMAR